MCSSSYRTTGWGRGHGWGRGRHISLFGPLLGLIVLFALFKSGLWLPLLGLGLAFVVFTHMNRQPWSRDWPYDGEKPKRDFGMLDGRPWYGPADPQDEKPKRGGYNDEYV